MKDNVQHETSPPSSLQATAHLKCPAARKAMLRALSLLYTLAHLLDKVKKAVQVCSLRRHQDKALRVHGL